MAYAMPFLSSFVSKLEHLDVISVLVIQVDLVLLF
jgi:hypothetical protein